MSFSSSSSQTLSCSPNVTPLIDVLLVLLIIFMAIVPATPRGLESLIPTASAPNDLRPATAPLLVEVFPSTSGSQVVYRLDRQEMNLQRLRTTLRASYAQRSDRGVLIGGDPTLDYGAVAAVVGEVKTDGFQSIGLMPRRGR